MICGLGGLGWSAHCSYPVSFNFISSPCKAINNEFGAYYVEVVADLGWPSSEETFTEYDVWLMWGTAVLVWLVVLLGGTLFWLRALLTPSF